MSEWIALEKAAKDYFENNLGIDLQSPFPILINVPGRTPQIHRFDAGSHEHQIAIECKCHQWVRGKALPPAKFSNWNEAMHLFNCLPEGFRKVFCVMRCLQEGSGKALSALYIERNGHLIPSDVEIYEGEKNPVNWSFSRVL
ncbi:hypothetical protein [Desulfocurvibacter africanus]|uniref:hypothetical protein n=1 Tax=Desulfocurvibacter africanus TaxID=873 RepID=UPI00068547B8|nr:hypothetical protein [Desulfocurvibacter africanus]